jgi:hypothetical protein
MNRECHERASSLDIATVQLWHLRDTRADRRSLSAGASAWRNEDSAFEIVRSGRRRLAGIRAVPQAVISVQPREYAVQAD